MWKDGVSQVHSFLSSLPSFLLRVLVLLDLGQGLRLASLPPNLPTWSQNPSASCQGECPNAHLIIIFISPLQCLQWLPAACIITSRCFSVGLITCLHPCLQIHSQLCLSRPFQVPYVPSFPSDEPSFLLSGPAGLGRCPINTLIIYLFIL